MVSVIKLNFGSSIYFHSELMLMENMVEFQLADLKGLMDCWIIKNAG